MNVYYISVGIVCMFRFFPIIDVNKNKTTKIEMYVRAYDITLEQKRIN